VSDGGLETEEVAMSSGRKQFTATVGVVVGLSALLAGGRPAAGGDDEAKNRAILAKLDEKITLKFQNAPFEDVLKYIKAASRAPGDNGIPIYVDPVELQNAGATMTTPVTIEAEGVPLKTSLRNLLKPLGLSYEVRQGLLSIVQAKAADKGEPKKDGAKPE
jgi:hypothetical protein